MAKQCLAALIGLAIVVGSAVGAPKKLLLIGTPPDSHPWSTHEYVAGMKLLEKLLKEVPGLEVSVVEARGLWKNGPELINRSDGVVLFVTEGGKWIQADPRRAKALQAVARRKGGLSVLHWGMGTRKAEHIAGCTDLFGACHGGPDRKYIVIETKLMPAAGGHPILNGIQPFSVKDEFYYKLKTTKTGGKLMPLIIADIKGSREMVSWAWERPDGGRSFGFSGLHFHNNWKRAEYRHLITQGVVWTMNGKIPKEGLTVKLTDKELTLPPRKKSGK